ADRNRLTIPNTTQWVVARFFHGPDPNCQPDHRPRQELADCLTSPNHPYFAKNLANRTSPHFFGRRSLDPQGQPTADIPASRAALLQELAREFAAGKFDNRVLIRAITRSKAYQLTSKMTHPTQADGRRFARMNLKGMTPSQLFDTLVVTTGYRE